ncbi:MAG: DUF4402 domain-containing protein [Salinisphaeraceae bacterium]|nr:DUF4402 domain-containing protein [Salinisphaeraceae bacterium]
MKKPVFVFSALAITSLSALAAEETFQASVQVLTPITITEDIAMSFGKIVAPGNGSPNTFFSTGALPTGSGDGSYISGAQTAQIDVTGDGGNAYTVNAAAVANGCSSTDLTLNITDPALSSASTTLVDLDGSLDVASGTAAGSYTCDYTVTANYQ